MADEHMSDAALTKVLARHLHAAGIGEYRDDGTPFTDGTVGIFYGALGDTPDRAIGIRVYATGDDTVGTATRRAQVRYRGSPRAPDGADDLAGLVFNALHGSTQVVGVSYVARVSSAPLGADQNGRQERTDNYTITLDNPEVLP